MNVAIIPARGGSKRIPRKNVRDFCGKPMIGWPISAAVDSRVFQRVIVSTDDEEIASVARSFGAEVPFIRPPELADDHAGLGVVIAHAVKAALDAGWSGDAVCVILATSPFIRAEDLERGLKDLRSGDWSFAFATTDFPAPIFRSFVQNPGGGLDMVFPQYYETRSQDLPVALHDAAQFYWGRVDAWLEERRVYDRNSTPVMIPRWRVQDVDTEEDWTRAEGMFRAMQEQMR